MYETECDHCDIETNNEDSCNEHVGTKHEKKGEYMCDECDFVASNRGRLRAHTGKNHGESRIFDVTTVSLRRIITKV